LQPTNLKNRTQQKIYYYIFGIIFWLISWMINSLISGIHGLIGGLIFGPISGLFFGLTLEMTENRINPVETFEFSLTPAKIRNFFQVLIIVLILTLIGGLIFGLIGGLIGVLFFGLIFGPISGLILGLFFWLKNSFLLRKYSNQGIFASLHNAIWITLFTTPILSFGIFFVRQVSDIQAIIPSALIEGIGIAVLFGFAMSGDEALKHFILRCLLYRNGSIPWNYARFLNYSTERMILQRVGRRYCFIHRLLQEHFAAQIIDRRYNISNIQMLIIFYRKEEMNVSISIDFSQLKTVIAQCNLEEKLELLRLPEKDTFSVRFHNSCYADRKVEDLTEIK